VRAALLCSAAASLLESTGASISSLLLDDGANYNRTITAVRAQLDKAAFATIWAQGRAMPLDQVVAEALAEA
jgi:hypothetical protein